MNAEKLQQRYPHIVRRDKKRHRTFVLVQCKCGRKREVRADQEIIEPINCAPSCYGPFQAAYNKLLYCARDSKLACSLTIGDFIELTKIKTCVYCRAPIPWRERSKSTPPIDKNADGRSYFLDRLDNNRGYEKGNVVVACSLCNLTRHSRFTYEEFLIIGKAIHEVRQRRKIQNCPR